MKKANDWQREIDYRKKLNPDERAWLNQWEREEYDASYEGHILNRDQARQARTNKARQSRDVLNKARYGLDRTIEAMTTTKSPAKRKTKKERNALDEAAKRVKKFKQTKPHATKEQMELTFVALSTAVLCMQKAKAHDENTQNNITMSIALLGEMSIRVMDEYTVLHGPQAAQRLMGLYFEEDHPTPPPPPEPKVGVEWTKEIEDVEQAVEEGKS